MCIQAGTDGRGILDAGIVDLDKVRYADGHSSLDGFIVGLVYLPGPDGSDAGIRYSRSISMARVGCENPDMAASESRC